MKRIKRIGVIVMGAVVALALLGCGGSKEEAKQMLVDAQEKMKDVQSMDFSMNMEMDLEAVGQQVAMKISGDMSIIEDPVQAKMVLQIDVGEGAETMELYAKQDGDQITMYSGTGTNYSKQVLTLPEFESQIAQYDANQNIEKYIEMFSDIEHGGSETYNGKSCTKVVGIVSGEKFQEVLNTTGSGLDSLEDAGLSSEQLQSIFSGIDDLEINIWIDNETGYIAGYEMDMTKMLQQVYDNLMDSLMGDSGISVEAKINKMSIEMTMENINNVEEIEIPQAALDTEV